MKTKYKVLAIIAVLLVMGGTYMFVARNDVAAPAAGPRIDSIVPATARVGDVVELRGEGFDGFEGDRYAWIQNASGTAGIIYGDRPVATDGFIRFTLVDRYCTADTSYSGLPCPSYIDIVPGSYTVSVKPWGVSSAPVAFTVVK